MGSRGSTGGRGSGVCEFWYMDGGVGERIGTWKQLRKGFRELLVEKKDNLYLFWLTCVGSGWTGTALGCGSRESGWTKGIRVRPLVSQKRSFLTFTQQHQCSANPPGGHTICCKSMLWLGFIGCAETMAGSMGCPSNSNMESWQHRGDEQTSLFHSPHVQGASPYLHEVVRSLHLCH